MALIKQISGDQKAKSSPIIRKKIELQSLQAQRVMTRSFEKLAESLFQIGVILRAIDQREHVDEAEAIIVQHFDSVSEDLTEKLEQLGELARQNGITAGPDYTNTATFEIEINTPHLARFAALVQSLDNLIGLIDAMWFNAILDDKQASNAKYEWRQRLIRVAGRIIGMAKRVRNEAYNSGKKAEVDAVAPEMSDEDMDPELKAESEIQDESSTTAKKKAAPATAKKKVSPDGEADAGFKSSEKTAAA